jgi:hypothetical protein
MAFQTGTQVDPRLMKADLSGFTKASEIQAQGMQALASGLTKGVEKFAKKREEKKIEDSAVEMATSWATRNPELAERYGFDVLDEDGFLNDDVIKKSAIDYVKTVKPEGINKSILGLLELEVKSQATASDKSMLAQQNAYDPMGYNQKLQMAQTNPSYRVDNKTGKVYYDPTPGKGRDEYLLTADDPMAKPFTTGKGYGYFFPDQIPTYSGGLGTGKTYQYRPEEPEPTVDPNNPAGLQL